MLEKAFGQAAEGARSRPIMPIQVLPARKCYHANPTPVDLHNVPKMVTIHRQLNKITWTGNHM